MNVEQIVRPIEILLVEDNPADVRLTMETIKNYKVKNRLEVVGNGVDAMDFLRRKGKFAHKMRPDLILLDLNLPGKDGREVLAEIKVDPDLCSIPVVVLTSSEAEQDIIKAYNLHVNCYITKPVGLIEFVKVVKSIEDFWLTIVKLPIK
jgi:CheY-like chemotaxis protein